jgi:hypothetical protein
VPAGGRFNRSAEKYSSNIRLEDAMGHLMLSAVHVNMRCQQSNVIRHVGVALEMDSA